MADNTVLNPGSGGDTVRSAQKTVNAAAKTQIVVLDIGGGADASPETALATGQQSSANSLPVTIASDQVTQLQAQTLLQAILIELRIHSQLLQQLVNGTDADLELMRNDISLLLQLPQ